METIVLTYRELADKLGIKPESARKTAQRKRWKRTTGNDGTVRIHVPVESLQIPRDGTVDSPTDTASIRIQLARLSAEIDGLHGVLAAERQRAHAAETDRDRWHALALRPWWKRLTG